jgi:hypothetical protein
MKKHRYRVTLEHLTDAKGAPSIHGPLQFEMANHDDIMVIIEWLRNRDDFTQEMAAPFGVGLKLFSEVMLENKGHPLFTPFMPHFIQFMKELKKDAGKT